MQKDKRKNSIAYYYMPYASVTLYVCDRKKRKMICTSNGSRVIFQHTVMLDNFDY